MRGREHLLLCERGNEPFLLHELRRAYPGATHHVRSPGLVSSSFLLQFEAPPLFAFSKQFLPSCEPHGAESINAWAQIVCTSLSAFHDAQPWRLHILPCYGSGGAGRHRCALIEKAVLALLQRKRRHLLKALQRVTPTLLSASPAAGSCSDAPAGVSALHAPVAFSDKDGVVQLLLTAPSAGFLSVAASPAPYELRAVLSPFPGGEVPIASDKAAPSRAFAKLVEAEARLGRGIQADERCVDLGASPGSWSYAALHRGARVVAVDRAPLREDLMEHPQLTFQTGDAFTYAPDRPVDWLLCDVIAAPERSIDLLLRWARGRLARYFVVTIKFKGTGDYGVLERLKYAMPPLCEEFRLTQLSANRNEVCAFGAIRAAALEPR